MNRKTISKAIALSGVITLSASICADNISNCYAGELLREIQAEQSKLPYASQNQVMQNVFKDYETLNHEVKNTLATIWHNNAGNLLLRRLHNVIKDDTQRITILWNTCDEKKESNYFRCFDSTVLLNKNNLGWYVGYCNNRISIFQERMDMVMFHELCHALHNLEGEMTCKQRKFIPAFYKLSKNEEICNITCKAWKDDEEIRTITGRYIDDSGDLKFDYLNANSYIILEELKKGALPEKIQQRVFHCDYPTLTTKYRLAKKLPLDGLVIPPGKYIDVQETTCHIEEWMDMS